MLRQAGLRSSLATALCHALRTLRPIAPRSAGDRCCGPGVVPGPRIASGDSCRYRPVPVSVMRSGEAGRCSGSQASPSADRSRWAGPSAAARRSRRSRASSRAGVLGDPEGALSPSSARLPPLSVRHLRTRTHDGRGRSRPGRTRGTGRARTHRAFRHGLSMRHVQLTRLVWLIAGLLVVACLVFADAQS